MNIEFTKEQYEQLIKAVYLGNWMVNATRTDDMIQEYEDLQSYILSHAKNFDLAHLADETSAEDGAVLPSEELEMAEDIDQMISDYDDEIFWEELIERMTVKDIFASMSEEDIEAMEEENFVELYEAVREKYEEEFDKNGLMNVDLYDCDGDECGDDGACCGSGCCGA